MDEPVETPEYSLRLLTRGGHGRDARWAWEIYVAGNLIPLEKGMYWGTEPKAYQAAKAAMKRVAEKRAEKEAVKSRI